MTTLTIELEKLSMPALHMLASSFKQTLIEARLHESHTGSTQANLTLIEEEISSRMHKTADSAAPYTVEPWDEK